MVSGCGATGCCLLAQNGGGGPVGGSTFFFLPMILIGVLFYFMLLRPEQKKRTQMETMQRNLKKNDRVLTVGGIYGTVVNAPQGSDDITLKVDENSNTRLRVTRSSIQHLLGAGESDDSKGSSQG
jgi:preprotein translocase subunit YajC